MQLVDALRKDCRFYWHDVYVQELQLYKSLLPRLKKELKEQNHLTVNIDETGELEFDTGYQDAERIRDCIKQIKKQIENFESSLTDFYPRLYAEKRERLEQLFEKADAQFRDIFFRCLWRHQPEGIGFHAALEEFIQGDFEFAIDKIRWMIETVEGRRGSDELLSKLYLLKGQIQSEFGQYAEAIIGLTTAIQKNPMMKEAYLERASAYFELGQFDRALEDFIVSGFHPTIENYTKLGIGITVGIAQGASESATEFIPSMIGTLRGLGAGLWALVQDPPGASNELVDAALRCIEYIKTHTSSAIVQDLVPELKELIQNYEYLEDFQKGKLIGHILGKYGMDIFLAREGTVMIKAYRDFKRANQVLTLETAAKFEHAAAILAEADQRWTRIHLTAIKNGKLKIHPQKQGRHIVGHPEYEALVKKGERPSILEHSDPNRLIREYAGTGIKDKRVDTGILPGMPGYLEIIDFKEFIGYSVNRTTGIKTPTSMGKIHYAQGDVHIVPYSPRRTKHLSE